MAKNKLIDGWIDAKDRQPKDEFQFLKLLCSDGRERYGYATRWADGSFAGWLIDGLRDFVEGTDFGYEVTGWKPSDVPEPAMEMPV